MVHLPAPLPLEFSPPLHDDMARIKLSLLITMIGLLITRNLSRLTPTKVIEMPECVGREDKVPNWQREEVDDHPSDVGDLARGDDDEQAWKTKNDTEEDQGDESRFGAIDSRADNQVDGERDGSRQDEGTRQFHEHDELHGEAESTAKIPDQQQFRQIVDCRVDPSSSLGQQDAEAIRDDRLANSLWTEDHLALGECLEHERCEVSIFTEQEQVLLVERVDNVLRIVFHNIRVSENGDPIAVFFLGCLDSVHRETTWKTSNTTKHGLESLGHVMGNIVFEDYNPSQ